MANQRFEIVLFNDPALTYPLRDEPVRWQELKLKRTRDKTYHGLNYLFADDDIPLEFDDDAGKAHIEYAYSLQGADADVRLRWFQTYLDGNLLPVEELRQEFKLNLGTRKIVDDRIQVSLSRPTLHDLIKANFETDIDLTRKTTLDGKAIGPAPIGLLRLHSQALANGYSLALTDAQTLDYTLVIADKVGSNFSSNSYEYWITMPSEAPTINDLPENIPTSLTVLGSNPVTGDLPWFKFDDNGTVDANITFSVDIDIRTKKRGLVLGAVKIRKWFLDPQLVIKKKSGEIQYNRIGAQIIHDSGASFGHIGPLTITGSYSPTITFEQGDELYLYVHVSLELDNKCDAEFKVYCPRFTASLSAKTTQDSSLALTMSYPDAVARALLIITGQEGILRADDYLTHEWVNYDLASGFSVRGFVDKPLTVSLKKLCDGALTLFGAGNGYETAEDGTQLFRMAQWSYFYQDTLLLELEDVADDWTEDVARDYLYAGIDVGYSKYPDSGVGVLDDPHTLHQYATTTKVTKDRFSLECPFIASGYALEITRREQFRDKPSDSTTYDDQVFVIATRSSSFTGTVGVTQGQIVLDRNVPDWIRPGVQLQIVGSTQNIGLYTVTSIGLAGGQPIVINVTGTLVLEFGIRTLIAPASGRQAERDESFAQVTGTIAPGSLYNLRITPTRMLLNWGAWLKSSLFYKRLTESLSPTFIKNNGELTTRLLVGDARPMGDQYRQLIIEKSAVYLAQLPEAKFQPELLTLKWVIGEEKARLLEKGLDGNGVNRYGYIQAKTNVGTVAGWILSSEYELHTGQLQLTLLKKAVISPRQHTPTPGECADYADWTLEMFANANPPVPDWIFSCIFDVFA